MRPVACGLFLWYFTSGKVAEAIYVQFYDHSTGIRRGGYLSDVIINEATMPLFLEKKRADEIFCF